MKKNILATIAALLLLTLYANAQTNVKQATARIFESQSAELSRIVVVYEDSTSEIIPLQNWKLFGGVASTNNILIENQKTINQFLNNMNSKGYELTKMTATGEAYLYTFIVFTRKN